MLLKKIIDFKANNPKNCRYVYFKFSLELTIYTTVDTIGII